MSNLNFYTISVNRFRSVFFSIQIANIIFSIITFLIIRNGGLLFPGVIIGQNFVRITLYSMVLLAFVFTMYQKNKLSKIVGIEEFDSKVNEYLKFYKYRMFWYLFSCVAACILGVLSGRMIFFYFAIIDVVIALPYYPTSFMFRKELKNDEIVIS
jgi:hypothetical protein